MTSYLKKFRGQQAALPGRFPAQKILLAGAGAAIAIGFVAALGAKTGQPLLLGSLGASCVFLFGLPEAPFSQPRNVIAGHLFSSLVGLVFVKSFGPQPWALALALGTAVMLMFATRTVHAPAGSNPVIVFLTQPDWSFLLLPTLAGAVGVVLVALLFNNAVHSGRYPLYWFGRAPANTDRAQHFPAGSPAAFKNQTKEIQIKRRIPSLVPVPSLLIMKTAIIVLSDPKAGTEEALGRVFNALTVAYEYQQAGEDVRVLFAGTGTRWPAVLNKASHPAYALYKQVLDTVVGVSCGCADVFGADDQGLARITTNAVPGTSGMPSLLTLQRDGYQILTF